MKNKNVDQQERVILSLYRNRSFTKAASELGISQPALSAAINKIESNLGIRIFDRKHTPVLPTEEGLVYISYLKKVQMEYKECFQKINDIVDNRNTVLTIGAPVAYASAFLPEKITEFCTKYPDCRISIRVAALPELIEMSKEGLIDCFISTTGKPDPEFKAVSLASEQIFLCVPKEWEINEQLSRYRLCIENGELVEPAEAGDGKKLIWSLFADRELIVLEDNQPLQRVVNEFLKKENFSAKSRIMVNQVLLGVELAAQGLGMCFASEAALKSCRNADRLAVYPLPEYISGRELYVAYKAETYQSDACRNFIEMIGV